MPFDESHVDDDVLALLALGEHAGTSADLAHIEECERCADELDALRGRRRAAAPRPRRRRSSRPRPHVWDRIADELGLARRRPGAGTERCRAVEPAPRRPSRSRRSVQLDAVATGRAAWRWVAAAAAAGVSSAAAGRGGRTTHDDPATVRRDRDARAAARLGRRRAPPWSRQRPTAPGCSSSTCRSTTAAPTTGFREVWLLKPDVSGLVSVGTLDGTSGRFDLPAGLDLTQFSVVDVSEEQFDGNPAHSGDSIVRGALRA